MDDPPEDIEDRAKELTRRLYDHLIAVARAMSLDDLEGFEKRMDAATPRNIIQQIHEYLEEPNVYGDI